ncbi:MAG: extracellular solute-binding protein [Chloroflexi bacterium]|nr:extracellular solute-binding protein [Chloroflexota bacterium]
MKALRYSLVLVLVALLALPAAAIYGQETIELQLTWWGSQTRHDKTIAVIEMFEAEHPNIDIIYEFSNFTDYWTLLSTKAASGSLPDVMQHDYAYLAEWALRGQLMPLDDFIADGTIDLSNVAQSVVDSGKIDGQTYGVSLGANSQAFILDVDAFEAAGLELPSPDWTWTEFEEVVTQIHDELGIWGFGTLLDDEALWKSLLIGHGEWAFSDDGTELGYEDDQPMIDHLNMILRLQETGGIPTIEEEIEFDTTGPEGSPLVIGKSAIQYQWSNQVLAVANAAGPERHFKLWHLPRPEGGQSSNYVKPSMFFSIPASAEHPEEAAMFIDFFTNSLEANEILAAERGVPVSAPVRDHLLPNLDPVMAETFDFLVRVEADSSPVPPPDPPGYADLRLNVYGPQFVDVVRFGEMSPEDAVAFFREEANRILAQNK